VAAVVSLLRTFSQNSAILDVYGLGPTVKSVDPRDGSVRPLRPDFIGRYANSQGASGIAIDAKWSLPTNRQGLVHELEDVKKYSGPLNDWPVRYDQLTTVHSADPTAYQYLKEPGYSVWTWGQVKTAAQQEVARIRRVWGKVRDSRLEALLEDRVDIPELQYWVEQTSVRFVGDRPPRAYVVRWILEVARAYVFGFPPTKEKVVSVSEMHRLFSKFFGPVTNESGPQVTQSTIREGMDLLAEIRYNVQKLRPAEVRDLGLPENEQWYRFRLKKPQGDRYKWICKELHRVDARRQAAAERRRASRGKPSKKGRTRIRSGRQVRFD